MRIESLSERLIMRKMPKSEKLARLFVARECTTSRFPRVTSTSVTSPLIDFRLDIASRCSWFLDLAIGNQGSVIKSFGLPQYSTCDINRIVKGKFVDDIDRRIVGAGQSLCELGAARYCNILL